MTVSIIGNRNSGGHSSPGGNGAANVPDSLTSITISASVAGDVALFATNGLIGKELTQGVFLQASISVDYYMTLSNPGIATNSDPLIQAEVLWGQKYTLLAGSIIQCPTIMTAFKLVFSGPGQIIIAAK